VEPAQGLKEIGLKSIGKGDFVPSKKYSFSPCIPELIKLILALVLSSKKVLKIKVEERSLFFIISR
jgi:hypothetical protein